MVDRPLPPLPAALLDSKVVGHHLRSGPLRAQLGPGPTLVVFLRPFGSPFAREIVAQLAAAREADAGFPAVVLVHQGSVAEGEAFLAPRWPEAVAVADPTCALYDAFGVERGGLRSRFGSGPLWRGVQVAFRGHRLGPAKGDGRRMPGAFLVQDAKVVWAHQPRHAGDQPDLRAIRALAAGV